MIYFLFFLTICVLSYFMTRNKKRIFLPTIIIGTLISLLIGLRAENIGNDTTTYITIFNESNIYTDFLQPSNGFEIGFIILMRIIGLFTNNPHTCLLIVAFITIMPMIYIIFKYSPTPWFSIFLFAGLGYFTFYMSGLRQSIALTLTFVALPLLLKRKIFSYSFFIILATFFHTSAIFAFIFIPFAYIDIKDINVLILLIITSFIAIFFNYLINLLYIFFPKYIRYFDGDYFNGTGVLASAFNLCTTLLLVFFIIYFTNTNLNGKKMFKYGIRNNNSNSHIFEWSIILVILLQIIGLRANMIDRITSYFMLAWILYLPQIAIEIKNKRNSQLFIICIILLYIFKFSLIQVLRPEWNIVLPYTFFWQK